MSCQPSKPPNVVLIIMDDLAWGDLACHGNPFVNTPHLDRLHSESARLTRYCSGPLCTPARASLMTGRYPYRTRAFDTYCGRSMLDPDEVTLAQILRDAGYFTGISGKWHLGDNYPMRAMERGFADALVHNGGGLRQPANHGFDGYFDPELMHNGKLTQYNGYCTDIFGDYAAGMIEQHKDEPFFVYFATNAPHTPLEVKDQWTLRFIDQGLNETLARLYAMVENIDTNVGKILDKLDELNLADDTIVIYTSDHGPCSSTSSNGETRFNASLRGIKGQIYEGGTKVPCFWRWPGKFDAGRDIDRIANPIDVMPTLASVCGGTLPDDRTIDGADLSPLLLGRTSPEDWPDRSLFMQWHRGNVPQRYRNYGVWEQRYKLVRTEAGGPDELFDIPADPCEQHDVAGENGPIVETMRNTYDTWFDDVCATRGKGNFDPPPIHLGTEHENPTILTRQDWRIVHENGWSDEDAGQWIVRVTQTAIYSLTFRFPPPSAPAALTFRCGNAASEHTIEPGGDSLRIDNVQLDEGDCQLEALLNIAGPTPIGMHTVTVERL